MPILTYTCPKCGRVYSPIYDMSCPVCDWDTESHTILTRKDDGSCLSTHGISGYAPGTHWENGALICGYCGERIENPIPTGRRIQRVYDNGILGKLHLKYEDITILKFGVAGEKPEPLSDSIGDYTMSEHDPIQELRDAYARHCAWEKITVRIAEFLILGTIVLSIAAVIVRLVR